MSHPAPPAKAKAAPVKALVKANAAPAGRGGAGGPPPPPGQGGPPAPPGGGGGGGGLARGSGAAAAPATGGLCPSCKEPNGGAKFCPKCGTLQPGAGGAAPVQAVAKRAIGVAGKFDIDFPSLRTKFEELCKKDTEAQTEFFLKTFIMALGDDWKQLLKLQQEFSKMLRDEGESDHDLNEVQAMTFLQKNGAERTSTQRREEVRDVDLDNNQRICFVEYLLLQFKVMILTEFYKRHECDPEEDLSKGGVGVTGVGPKLLDQLFCQAYGELPPELVKAIEEFTTMMRARNAKLNDLQAKSKGASVKAMAAANEIKQMENEDPTEMNRIEIALNAAKKKALKTDGSKVLEEKKKAELKAEEEKRAASRSSLREKAALWN